MSVSVNTIVVPPGDDTHVEKAWALKESIRKSEGVLKQRRRFFFDAYEEATIRAVVTRSDERLIGFAATRDGGYLLFLAVDPEFRGEGIGRELVAAVLDQHDVVTCHARTSNEGALAFYDHLGFEVVRKIDGYYEDGGDAYFLKLGEREGIGARIVNLFSG